MYFKFQESFIWDGACTDPAPDRKPVSIKALSEEMARKKLPKPDLGRKWILIETKDKPKAIEGISDRFGMEGRYDR